MRKLKHGSSHIAAPTTRTFFIFTHSKIILIIRVGPDGALRTRSSCISLQQTCNNRFQSCQTWMPRVRRSRIVVAFDGAEVSGSRAKCREWWTFHHVTDGISFVFAMSQRKDSSGIKDRFAPHSDSQFLAGIRRDERSGSYPR